MADENVKVQTVRQPGVISEACGITYSQFTLPRQVTLKNDPYQLGKENNIVKTWMELITPTTIGCMTSDAVLRKVLEDAAKKANVWG